MVGEGEDEVATLVATLSQAISAHRKVRLVYRRAKDGITSIHEVAPIDIQGGDRTTSRDKPYLWAWCFAERELEMHALDRIVRAMAMPDVFDTAFIWANWPQRWPKPAEWNIPRDW